MNREKIANILSQTDGLTITNAEELIEALFFGDINIFEKVPYYPEPDRTESKKLEDLLMNALTLIQVLTAFVSCLLICLNSSSSTVSVTTSSGITHPKNMMKSRR